MGRRGGQRNYILGFYQASKVVLKPLNIVFTEIGSRLDLDEDQRLFSNILDPVRGSDGYVNGGAGRQRRFQTIQCHFCRSANDHPVLGAAGVLLIAEALFW